MLFVFVASNRPSVKKSFTRAVCLSDVVLGDKLQTGFWSATNVVFLRTGLTHSRSIVYRVHLTTSVPYFCSAPG